MTIETGFVKNKHIAIFGGSSGLGQALAERLDNDGANVTILSRDAIGANPKIPGRRINVDVTNASSVEAVFKNMDREGEIDIVINAAGHGLRARASQTTPEQTAKVVCVDLLGVIYTSREAAKRMERRKSGIIVNVGSTSGLKPRLNESSYVAAKWGVTGYTRSLRMELNPEGVAVVLANPGGMDTPFWDKADPTQNLNGFMNPRNVANKIVDYILQPNLLQTEQEILIERPQK